MDLKGVSLLIGLAVITSTAGCLSFADREKRQLTSPSEFGQQQTSTIPQYTRNEVINNNNNNNNNNNINDDINNNNHRHQPSDSKEVSHDIALKVLELSQRLTSRKLDSQTDSKYEVLSPISITSALQLAFLASKGDTFSQLRDLFKYSETYSLNELHREFGKIIKDLQSNEMKPEREIVNWRQNATNGYVEKYMRGQSKFPDLKEHKIEMANGIFIQNDITVRQQYRDVVTTIYQSEIQSLNFKAAPEQSASTINDWVKAKTHDKIRMIVPRVMNVNTRAVLVNALYFNAEWQTSFVEGVTRSYNFYPNGKNEQPIIQANLMAHGGIFPHYHDNETNTDILGFPYKQNSTTMYVLLPRDSSRRRLKEVQKLLTAEKIDAMIDQMTLKTTVALFPKMHLSSSHYLKPDLQDMGVTSLFDESSCDLSLLTIPHPPSKLQDTQIHFNGPVHKGGRSKRGAISYKTQSEDKDKQYQLGFKDFLLKKRIVKNNGGGGVSEKKKTIRRSKRDALEVLENVRNSKNPYNPRLYADEVIHKVDLNINEKGTEGGAATAIALNRSGTRVIFRVDTPFLFLIRHDPTRIPLFYGAVFEPPTDD